MARLTIPKEWFLGLLVVALALAIGGVAIVVPHGSPAAEGPSPASTEPTPLSTPTETPAAQPPAGSSVEVADLQPTYAWINAYSLNSTLDGAPLPVGSVVEAYDAEGTLAGRFVVSQEGRYGLMPIYQDDPETSVDEGAEPGDVLVFLVNGFVAQVMGPDRPVWTSNGDLLQLDLVATSY